MLRLRQLGSLTAVARSFATDPVRRKGSQPWHQRKAKKSPRKLPANRWRHHVSATVQKQQQLERRHRPRHEPPVAFSVAWKEFVMMVHPDQLLAEHPEIAARNEKSLASLNEAMDRIRNRKDYGGTYPRAGGLDLLFHVRRPETQLLYPVRLRTFFSGGDCRTQLRKDLTAFFQSCGVALNGFVWGGTDW